MDEFYPMNQDVFLRIAHTPADQLPEHYAVQWGKTPSGGDFTVMLFLDASNNPCSKEKAARIEICECDYRGKPLFRTYLGKKI